MSEPLKLNSPKFKDDTGATVVGFELVGLELLEDADGFELLDDADAVGLMFTLLSRA